MSHVLGYLRLVFFFLLTSTWFFAGCTFSTLPDQRLPVDKTQAQSMPNAEIQEAIDFPLVSLSSSSTQYQLLNIQVSDAIEPGNANFKRAIFFITDDNDTLFILAQEPVSSLVNPRHERIKDEAALAEDVLIREHQAVIVAVKHLSPLGEQGYLLSWQENGYELSISSDTSKELLFDLAEMLEFR